MERGVTIRRARADEWEALYRIGLGVPEFKLGPHPFLSPEEFRDCIEDPKGLFLVGEHDGELAGFLVAGPEGPTLAFVYYLAVLPEFRRVGIASALLGECGAHFRERGVQRIGGFAFTNGTIVEFLHSHGFEEGSRYTWMERPL